MRAKSLSCVRLFVTPWTVARQAPLSMGFSRQEHWSGLPCPPPGDLPDPGIEPESPTFQVDSSPLSHLGSPCYHQVIPNHFRQKLEIVFKVPLGFLIYKVKASKTAS